MASISASTQWDLDDMELAFCLFWQRNHQLWEALVYRSGKAHNSWRCCAHRGKIWFDFCCEGYTLSLGNPSYVLNNAPRAGTASLHSCSPTTTMFGQHFSITQQPSRRFLRANISTLIQVAYLLHLWRTLPKLVSGDTFCVCTLWQGI